MRCLLFVGVCCVVLFGVWCALFGVLAVVGCVLFVVMFFLWFAGCCLMSVERCSLLSVVCCSLCVVVCWLVCVVVCCVLVAVRC